jgi:tetratricopeptide (TPR) repeat protein
VVDSLNVDQRHWKTALNAEVMAHLRAGQNEISVTVSNFQGPPALWLAYLTFWVRSADPARWRVNGTSLAAQQRWVEAIDCFSQAVRLEPGSVAARTALANALRSAGKPGEAQKEAEIAMSQNPASPEASLELGFSCASAGLDEEALGFFRNTIRQAPDSPNAHEQLVNCLCRLHRYQEALTACSEGLRVDPYNYFTLNNFAWIRATGEDSLRNGAEAVAAAERACALSSYSNAQIIGTLAAAYAEAGRFPEAVRTAQRACEVAKGHGQQELAAKNAQLMELYRTGQPCREN